MRLPPLLAMALAFHLTMYSQPPKTMAAMKYHARPLLVFEGGDAKNAEKQLVLLSPHAAAMQERQVIAVGVEGTNKGLPTTMLPRNEWQAAQRRFHTEANEFTVVLLGKDGGEKLRSHQPIAWETLQETIDAMPMRKEEANRSRR